MSDHVIHDGQLIHKDQALALMLVEFTPYGYTKATIERALFRAFMATQNFLSQLAWQPPDVQKSALDAALKKDAANAAQWRASAPGVREDHARRCRQDEEAQAERIKRYRRDQEEQVQKCYEQEQIERKALIHEAVRKIRLHQDEAARKARLQCQFDQWQRGNDLVQEVKDAAPLRALQRQREDQDRKWRQQIARIEYEQNKHRIRAGTDLSDLEIPLSDHDYIEWRFRCASHPNRRYLAECPIVRPAI